MIIREKPQVKEDLIDNILYNSVEDINFHLFPNEEHNIDTSKLNSIPLFSKAVETLYKHLDNSDSKIAILVDNDMDGFASATLFIKFMQELNCPIDIIIDEGKTHGLTQNVMNTVLTNEYNLIIIPDSGSNDIDQHKLLRQHNVDFIVLDHHHVEEDNIPHLNNNGIVINNQLLDLNKNYTGVGMVYIFLQYINVYKNLDLDLEKYLDLVMLGSTGDVADISDKELRNYSVKGTQNINNKFIKRVLEQRGIKDPTTRDMSFSIISMVNAVCRIGTVDEKHLLINAFTNQSDEKVEMEVRSKNKVTKKMEKHTKEVSIEEYAYDVCRKIKDKQDRQVKKAVEDVEYINEENVIIGLLPDKHNPSLTGLIAMKIMSKTGLPTLIGKDYDGYYAGSARSTNNLKEKLYETGLFDLVQGHSNAFGWQLQKDILTNLLDWTTSLEQTETYHLVDRIYDNPESKVIYEVDSRKGVFGGRVEYPLLAYENISFHRSCINARGSMLKLLENKVEFVLFNAPEGLYDRLMSSVANGRVNVSIVGEPSINDFGGRLSAQIVIKDLEIKEKEEDTMNSFGVDF